MLSVWTSLRFCRLVKSWMALDGILFDWLIDLWCLMRFWTVFQIYRVGLCTYPCFPRVLLTSTPHNIFPKHTGHFPTCSSSKQWTVVREEWILSQWLPSIFGKTIGPAGGSNQRPPVLSPIHHRLSYGARCDSVWHNFILQQRRVESKIRLHVCAYWSCSTLSAK